jgi:cysteine desulfurase/selenocysteine lyase
MKVGFERIEAYETELLDYATTRLKSIPNLKIYGEAKNKTSVISFNIGELHSYDLGTILDKYGIAVRTGQHCAQPVMDFFGISGTVRASFSFYNTKEEIDYFYESLKKAVAMLS